MREARELLANTLTIVGGRPFERLTPEPPAPWAEDPIWPHAQQPFTEQQKTLRELGHTPTAMADAAARSAAAERSATATAASAPDTD